MFSGTIVQQYSDIKLLLRLTVFGHVPQIDPEFGEFSPANKGAFSKRSQKKRKDFPQESWVFPGFDEPRIGDHEGFPSES